MSDETQPDPTPLRESIEKASIRGSAAIVDSQPSDQFIAPVMNLDGPPAAAQPAEGSAGD